MRKTFFRRSASLCVPSTESGQSMRCRVVRCTTSWACLFVPSKSDRLTDQGRVWSSGILGVVRQVGLTALSRKKLVVTKPVQLITVIENDNYRPWLYFVLNIRGFTDA